MRFAKGARFGKVCTPLLASAIVPCGRSHTINSSLHSLQPVQSSTWSREDTRSLQLTRTTKQAQTNQMKIAQALRMMTSSLTFLVNTPRRHTCHVGNCVRIAWYVVYYVACLCTPSALASQTVAETGFPSALLFSAWFITGTTDYSFLGGCLC